MSAERIAAKIKPDVANLDRDFILTAGGHALIIFLGEGELRKSNYPDNEDAYIKQKLGDATLNKIEALQKLFDAKKITEDEFRKLLKNTEDLLKQMIAVYGTGRYIVMQREDISSSSKLPSLLKPLKRLFKDQDQ